jgi:hypothetical protein
MRREWEGNGKGKVRKGKVRKGKVRKGKVRKGKVRKGNGRVNGNEMWGWGGGCRECGQKEYTTVLDALLFLFTNCRN